MLYRAAVLKMEAPAPRPPDFGWGNHSSVRVHTSKGRNNMNRSIALGLAMLAGTLIGATAVNGLHAQNNAPGAYAALDLGAIKGIDVTQIIKTPGAHAALRAVSEYARKEPRPTTDWRPTRLNRAQRRAAKHEVR